MIGTLYGRRVQIAPRFPRVQVSPEFARIQDPALVEKTNAWMASFFGYRESVPDGQIYNSEAFDLLIMNQNTYARLMAELEKVK